MDPYNHSMDTSTIEIPTATFHGNSSIVIGGASTSGGSFALSDRQSSHSLPFIPSMATASLDRIAKETNSVSRYRVCVVSDLHLGAPPQAQQERQRSFQDLLVWIDNQSTVAAGELLILVLAGDIYECWSYPSK
jgi:hypothetical protein